MANLKARKTNKGTKIKLQFQFEGAPSATVAELIVQSCSWTLGMGILAPSVLKVKGQGEWVG